MIILLYFDSKLYPWRIEGTSSFQLYARFLRFFYLQLTYICKFRGREIIYDIYEKNAIFCYLCSGHFCTKVLEPKV